MIGSAFPPGMFATTLGFLFTTPGVVEPALGSPASRCCPGSSVLRTPCSSRWRSGASPRRGRRALPAGRVTSRRSAAATDTCSGRAPRSPNKETTTMRFISPRIHGFLDYAVAAGLITAPLALDFAAVSPLAAVISIVAGLGLVAYSLLTDYSVSVRDLIPWRVHLTLDSVAAVALLLAPFALGFDGIPRALPALRQRSRVHGPCSSTQRPGSKLTSFLRVRALTCWELFCLELGHQGGIVKCCGRPRIMRRRSRVTPPPPLRRPGLGSGAPSPRSLRAPRRGFHPSLAPRSCG